MASRSPSRSLSRGRTRVRSYTPRSASRNRKEDPRDDSTSRTRSPRPNGDHSRSPSRSLSRSRSRSRSPTPRPANTKIVVEKLTKNINEAHLREIYSKYGSIVSLDLPLNRQFMTNRGTAYIVYEYQEDAEAALACTHGGFLDGTTINVSIVPIRDEQSESPPQSRRMREHNDHYNRPPPRFGNRGFNGGRYRSPGRRGSPPRRPFPHRSGHDSYIPPPRSYHRSRSPLRPRSPGDSGRYYRSRDSPPPRDYSPPRGGGRGRRSPSYSSYSYSDRSRSSSRRRDSRR